MHKESIALCRKLHGSSHPTYAIVLSAFAAALIALKQYPDAIAHYQEALTIFESMNDAAKVQDITAALSSTRHLLRADRRKVIDAGHEHRLCNQCGQVAERMPCCEGCGRVWYCNSDCQLRHWVVHRPLCNFCSGCDAVLSDRVRLHCGRCRARYCDAECQRAHWSLHKQQCALLESSMH